MKKIVRLFLMTTVILLLANCAGKNPKTLEDTNIYYAQGEKKFEKGKYLQAIDDFRLYILNNPGGQLADDAQYYIGESYYNRDEYLLAIAEFTQLVERYKYSELLVDGYFKIAMSYYELSPKYQRDQSNTEKALRQLQEFIDAYPNTNNAKIAQGKIDELRTKLGRKLYESGKIYRKMGHWDAAIIYQDDMLNSYYDTDFAIYAKYEKAYCYIKKRDFKKFEEVKEEITDADEITTEEKTNLLQKLEKMLNRELRKVDKEKRKRKDEERRKNRWF